MTSISTINPLKPERIGLTAALTARSPLKPERIGQRPVISQVWNAVTVVLPGEGAVTEADLDFAESLMLLPQVGSGAEGQTPPVQGPSQEVPPVAVAS
jgi:hypothetical protein